MKLSYVIVTVNYSCQNHAFVRQLLTDSVFCELKRSTKSQTRYVAPWASAERGKGAVIPGFSYMISLMCFSTNTRFVKTTQPSPTILVGWFTLRGRSE